MRLWHGKVPYENKFHPLPGKEPEKWAESKKLFEFGMAPMLEIDGMKLVESFAISNYLDEKLGLKPTDTKQRYMMLSSQELLKDIVTNLIPFLYAPSDNKEAKEAMLKKWLEQHLDVKLGYLEKRLKENECQDYLVGKELTGVDVDAVVIMHSIIMPLNGDEGHLALLKEVLDKHPLFVGYCAKLRDTHFKDYFENVRIKPVM